MQVVGIIIFCVLALFVTWLAIDTVIYSVKKVKAKKEAKKNQENVDKDNEVINGTDNK